MLLKIIHCALVLAIGACRCGEHVDPVSIDVPVVGPRRGATNSEDSLATLRQLVPRFQRPERAVIDVGQIVPSPVVDSPFRPLVDTAPVLRPPSPSISTNFMGVEGACERLVREGGGNRLVARGSYGSSGLVAGWEDSDQDGDFDVAMRISYDKHGRASEIVHEDRQGNDRCGWDRDVEQLGYDDHGVLVHRVAYSRINGTDGIVTDFSRQYDSDDRVRWIHKLNGEGLLRESIELTWSGEHVTRVDKYDAKGKWEQSWLASWLGNDYVRVDSFGLDASSFVWEGATIFRLFGGSFVDILGLEGDVTAPTVWRETELTDEGQTTVYSRLGVPEKRILVRPDRSSVSEAVDENGVFVVTGGHRWLNASELEYQRGDSKVVYRFDCEESPEPQLAPFPTADECPALPEPAAIHGPDEGDR